MQAQLTGYDCALGKEELKPVYDTFIASHLTQTNQPDWGFDAWYSTLDKWNRTMIYASKLKEYLLSVGYNKWSDINPMLPGLRMDLVVDTPKLSQLPTIEPVATPALARQWP
jgi:hypothetical protein